MYISYNNINDVTWDTCTVICILFYSRKRMIVKDRAPISKFPGCSSLSMPTTPTSWGPTFTRPGTCMAVTHPVFLVCKEHPTPCLPHCWKRTCHITLCIITIVYTYLYIHIHTHAPLSPQIPMPFCHSSTIATEHAQSPRLWAQPGTRPFWSMISVSMVTPAQWKHLLLPLSLCSWTKTLLYVPPLPYVAIVAQCHTYIFN